MTSESIKKVFNIPDWVKTSKGLREVVGDKATDIFCEALNISKGKSNNETAAKFAQMGMSAKDVAKYCNFETYDYGGTEPTNRSHDNRKIIDKQKRRVWVSESDIKHAKEVLKQDANFWEDCLFGRKLLNEYGDKVKVLFGEEKSGNVYCYRHSAGLTHMSQFNCLPTSHLQDGMEGDALEYGNGLDGVSAHHLTSLMLGSSDKVKDMFKKELERPLDEVRGSLSRMTGMRVSYHSVSPESLMCYQTSVFARDYKRWLSRDLEYLANLSDAQKETVENLPSPTFNGSTHSYRKEERQFQPLSAFIYHYMDSHKDENLYRMSTSDIDALPKGYDRFYQDIVPDACQKCGYGKYYLSPMYCNGAYHALDLMEAVIVMTGYDYKGGEKTCIMNVMAKVIQFYQKYEKVAKQLGKKTARDTVVEMFNQWANSKGAGVYMLVKEDTELTDEIEKKSTGGARVAVKPNGTVRVVINGKERTFKAFTTKGGE